MVGHRTAVAETRTETALVGGSVVHLDVERVGVLGVGEQGEIVTARGGFAPSQVRSRNQVEDLLRDRADPVGRDDVAGERRAVGAVRIAGGGVIDQYLPG